MTVQELIEQLGYMDPNANVHFSYNYGDHWRTQVAPSVGSVEEGVVEFSDYHRMDRMVEEYEDQFDEETGEFRSDVRKVVVLG
jgi:hypothetical protein